MTEQPVLFGEFLQAREELTAAVLRAPHVIVVDPGGTRGRLQTRFFKADHRWAVNAMPALDIQQRLGDTLDPGRTVIGSYFVAQDAAQRA